MSKQHQNDVPTGVSLMLLTLELNSVFGTVA